MRLNQFYYCYSFWFYLWMNYYYCFFGSVLEVLSKENIVEPMRDIRRALLEADVSEILQQH